MLVVGEQSLMMDVLTKRHERRGKDKSLLRYRNLKSMPKPTPHDIGIINHVLQIAKHSKFLLKDSDVESWTADNKDDLIALAHSSFGEGDPLTDSLRGPILARLHLWFGSQFLVCATYICPPVTTFAGHHH